MRTATSAAPAWLLYYLCGCLSARVRGRCTTRQSNAACFQASCGCSGRLAELRKGVRAHQAELVVLLCAVQPLTALQVAELTYTHGPRRTLPAALAGAAAVPPGHPTAVRGAVVRPYAAHLVIYLALNTVLLAIHSPSALSVSYFNMRGLCCRVRCCDGMRRRLHVSTSFRQLRATTLHCQARAHRRRCGEGGPPVTVAAGRECRLATTEYDAAAVRKRLELLSCSPWTPLRRRGAPAAPPNMLCKATSNCYRVRSRLCQMKGASWPQVPLAPLPPREWASLALDVRGLVARCFGIAGPVRGNKTPDGGAKASSCAAAGQPSGGAHGTAAAGTEDAPPAPPAVPWAYAGLDGICVLGAGRVRRIFTLRDAPPREVTPCHPWMRRRRGRALPLHASPACSGGWRPWAGAALLCRC